MGIEWRRIGRSTSARKAHEPIDDIGDAMLRRLFYAGDPLAALVLPAGLAWLMPQVGTSALGALELEPTATGGH